MKSPSCNQPQSPKLPYLIIICIVWELWGPREMTSKQEKLGTLKRKRLNSKLHILSPSNDIYTGNPFLYTHQSSLHIIFISGLCVCLCVCMCTPYNKRRVRRAKLQKPLLLKKNYPLQKFLSAWGFCKFLLPTAALERTSLLTAFHH